MISLSPADCLKVIGASLVAALVADLITGSSTRREMEYQIMMLRMRAENEAQERARVARAL